MIFLWKAAEWLIVKGTIFIPASNFFQIKFPSKRTEESSLPFTSSFRHHCRPLLLLCCLVESAYSSIGKSNVLLE